jgi:hypothetical protein
MTDPIMRELARGLAFFAAMLIVGSTILVWAR